jgi:DNA (cytosine-5)-methyltransferase 1
MQRILEHVFLKDPTAKYGLRPFFSKRVCQIAGFPDDFKFENKRSSYRLIGNAVPVHMGEMVGKEAMKYFQLDFP